MKGIDVSKWQGDIDWNKVAKSGIDFVIIRAGYGREINQKDPYFEKNYAGAKAAGLKVGAYWYSYADSAKDAETEASVCLEVLKGKTFEMPIYFDVEEKKQFAKGKQFCSDLVKAFCNKLESAGYFAGLYMSRYFLQKYITNEVANRYALWIAEYSSKLNYVGKYGIWQNSSSGSVPGITGNVDTNICYIDYPEIIKKAALNNFGKTVDTYIVKKGDTLTLIAKKYNTTVDALVKKNKINNANLIYPGQKLRI